jgi:hypothetical protein
MGYVGLTLGIGFAIFAALIVWLIGSGTAALVSGGVLAAITLLFTLPMLFGGKKLEASGDNERDQQRVQAVFALAANRGGVLRARDAAAALDMTPEAADAFLTQLAKNRYGEMDVDVTDRGEVVYTFPRLFTVEPSQWGSVLQGARVRIDAPASDGSSVGRATAPTATMPTATMPTATMKSSSSPPPIIDADFEEIEEERSPARGRA